MNKIKEGLHNTPLWLINLISILSGMVTIITSILGIITIKITGDDLNSAAIVMYISTMSLSIILFFRVKKYRQIAQKRMAVISEKIHKFSHASRDIYFDILHNHKLGTLTENELHTTYKNYIGDVLDNMCEVMNSFTEKKVCACVKLFTYTDREEVIDENNSKLITFCRSKNSDTNRDNYEKRNSKDIYLKDNTDFRYILDGSIEKDYFYQGNLVEFNNKLKETGKRYRNTNINWEQYYRGTIVVPIRIECKHLYNQNQDSAFHIMGFLCVDSMDTDAFREEQENYNVDMIKAYADMIYIFLDQYKYYLNKLPKSVNI